MPGVSAKIQHSSLTEYSRFLSRKRGAQKAARFSSPFPVRNLKQPKPARPSVVACPLTSLLWSDAKSQGAVRQHPAITNKAFPDRSVITILEVFDDHEKHGQYHSSPLYSSKLTTDVAFSPRFERIWLESNKRPPEYMAKKTANAALRSQYSLRLYSWAKKYVEEAPLPVWANFQQRALDVAILEINTKTDLNQAQVDRTVKAPTGSRAEVHDQTPSDTEGPPFRVRPNT
jgi:hypothetical protein